MADITIIGGGLAGSEAAFQAARAGKSVALYEMKPQKYSPAHTLEGPAELVCSNSLKAISVEKGTGLLKEEMARMGSLIVEAAYAARVPAGGALAVDREVFSKYVEARLIEIGVEIIHGEVETLPVDRPLIIATGPLTSEAFSKEIEKLVGSEHLAFYDAVSPIVTVESIGMEKAFFASRYGKGEPENGETPEEEGSVVGDYINCPMNKEEYAAFVCALKEADRVPLRDFEDTKYYEGCLPVEEMADRGDQTLAFGPLKPVGLTDPRTGRWPAAVVQLRRENREGTLYNLVGFQTRLTYGEQRRIFRMIPGLEKAEFVRLGKVHRNSYINSPKLLSAELELESAPGLFFAGQLTGVEGYTESSAMGLVAGVNAARLVNGLKPLVWPETTMTGALLRYISESESKSFQPMNANFGLLPTIKGPKRERKRLYAERALNALSEWKKDIGKL